MTSRTRGFSLTLTAHYSKITWAGMLLLFKDFKSHLCGSTWKTIKLLCHITVKVIFLWTFWMVSIKAPNLNKYLMCCYFLGYIKLPCSMLFCKRQIMNWWGILGMFYGILIPTALLRPVLIYYYQGHLLHPLVDIQGSATLQSGVLLLCTWGN